MLLLLATDLMYEGTPYRSAVEVNARGLMDMNCFLEEAEHLVGGKTVCTYNNTK